MANTAHHLDPLRNVIQKRLVDLGMSAREVSHRAGFNRGFLGDFLTKRAKSSDIEGLTKIAAILGIEDPFGHPAPSGGKPEASMNHQPFEAQKKLVPLFSARTPTSSQFMPVPETPAGFVPAIPAFEHITGVYAFTVPNDSNDPRYLPGEVVYVSPVAAPRAGDFVFLRFADGRAGVTRLLEMADGRISVRSLNAPRAQSFALDEVVTLHRIVAAIG